MLLSAALFSCSRGQNKTISLASFQEHDVDVLIQLVRQSHGEYILNATFTPPRGYHLYSKDIPAAGVDGVGRPTLLALTPKSLMKVTGPLAENKKTETPDFEPKELLVYPPGAVTLSLPVELPTSDLWIQDELSVTYMACSNNKCKPPVEGRIVPVRIPGAGIIDSQ
jgi:hypothetical protein